MPRRAVGFLALLLGAVVQVVALLRAGNEDLTSLLLLIVALALLAVAVLAAQAALDSYLRRIGVADVQHAPRPRHAVLLCNPWSGGGKVEKFGLVGRANSLGVETVLLDHGLDLEALARGAVADGADCLGMAGGDGSQALVASIAVQHDLPFVCVSAGTRNHFALDLGLDRRDPRQSLHAFTDAVERRVDYATVNGRFFVNNVSLGAYAAIVQQEGYRDAKAETTGRLLPDMLGQHTEPFDLQFVDPGRPGSGRLLPDHGVEQPLRARALPRRLATPPPRFGAARRLRGERPHGRADGGGGHLGSGRQRLGQRVRFPVRMRHLRGAVALGQGLRRGRR